MRKKNRYAAVLVLLAAGLWPSAAACQHGQDAATYLGFDRNNYPGDDQLGALRKSFAFTGYWLSPPPGERSNGWQGKRERLKQAGFGFVLLFNGRTYAKLKGVANPGATDGAATVRAARREGFHEGSIIFLDQEEGGRMLREQKEYIFAWAEAVRRAGFRAGVYCSGIEVAEEDGGTVSTALDLHQDPRSRELAFWIANDACPPSPGCIVSAEPPAPEESGVEFAALWQFAQSPLRRKFAADCAHSYNRDGNCYAPGIAAKLHLDLSSSRSPDPSHGRD